MTGDAEDMRARLRAVLPAQWFPDDAPVLDALLTGLGTTWSWLYGLVTFARRQTRLATASGLWLDMISSDLFGYKLARRSGEADDAFRTRIGKEIGRRRGTRAAVTAVLTDLTGRAPVVFEPARITDTGAWGAPGVCNAFAYDTVGGWGDLLIPFQVFVTAYRASEPGIAIVGGWGGPAGYGVGAIEYGSMALVTGPVTDADIYAGVASVVPVTGIAWTRISN